MKIDFNQIIIINMWMSVLYIKYTYIYLFKNK